MTKRPEIPTNSKTKGFDQISSLHRFRLELAYKFYLQHKYLKALYIISLRPTVASGPILYWRSLLYNKLRIPSLASEFHSRYLDGE